jgi:hypothetical protein
MKTEESLIYKSRKFRIKAVGVCQRGIALMPKSVFDLREGEQVSK